jgi:hypothetical protein
VAEQVYNYQLSNTYGAKKPGSHPQVYNYQVAPITEKYGSAWEASNNDAQRALEAGQALQAADLKAYQDQAAAILAATNTQLKQMQDDAAQAKKDRAQAAQDRADAQARENVARQSAYDDISEKFGTELGLDAGQIKGALKTMGKFDYANTQKMVNAVRSTQTWQDRFGAVTAARKKSGLSYLSEAQIVGLEDQYRASLSQYGLPKSFYDSPKDFQNWIANDVSPTEVANRAALASEMVNSVDQGTKDAFKQYWGVGQGDLTAYFLDRGRATDLLQKQVQAAELASDANSAKIGGLNKGYFETLAGKGVSRDKFQGAANEVGATQEDWKRLAQVSGQSLAQASLLNANLGLDAGTTKKLKGLASQERGRFAGSGGGTSALGGGSTAGSY